jgi:hypothetical protein
MDSMEPRLYELIQIINAVAVVVLVCVTGYYAWTTKKILENRLIGNLQETGENRL